MLLSLREGIASSENLSVQLAFPISYALQHAGRGAGEETV
jgi:hypothetical protein